MDQLNALIVEDNVKNLQILAMLLSDQGISHTAVTDPKHMEAALDAKIDIVFLDLEMPGLTGYEVMEQLKADGRFKGIPFVACTVHSGEMNKAHDLGFDSFIGKPLDPDRFPEQLTRILHGEGVWERM
jgi:two-component system cell cycle response regulator DivK